MHRQLLEADKQLLLLHGQLSAIYIKNQLETRQLWNAMAMVAMAIGISLSTQPMVMIDMCPYLGSKLWSPGR